MRKKIVFNMKRRLMFGIVGSVLIFSLCACNKVAEEDEQVLKVCVTEERVEAEVEEEQSEAGEDYVQTDMKLEEEKAKQEMLEALQLELDEYMQDRDFVSVVSTLQTFKLDNPSLDELNEVEAEYKSQIMGVVDALVVEADDYARNIRFEEAYQKIQEATSLILPLCDDEEWSDYCYAIRDRDNIYSKCSFHLVPVELLNNKSKVFDSARVQYCDFEGIPSSYYLDRHGNAYDKFYRFSIGRGKTGFLTFNADCKYEYFSAGFVMKNKDDLTSTIDIEVYGDDTLLYTYEAFSSYEKPATIEINITGYELITFKATRRDDNPTWVEPSIAMYEASFYNVTPMEFEAYKPLQ